MRRAFFPADPDLRRLYLAALLRAVANGFVGVFLGLELERRGFRPSEAGWVITAGLAGSALATLLAMLWGDRCGRRRSLVALAALTVAGGLAATQVEGPALLGVVAFLGLINGMGRDRGAALVLEQAAMPSLVAPERRTLSLAVYNVLQDAGHAVGSVLVAALPVAASAPDAASGTGFVVYALLLAPGLLLAAGLSARVENADRAARARLSPESRPRVVRLCALFGVDSFAGGFLTSALLAWFFFERFGASAAAVGMLFAAARVANAFSHLGAAWLARRFGLVNTMVFTHIPSSVLLATVPFAPTFPIAAILFLLREGLVEMDVPTRQSYVLAVVRPEERTLASGATHLVRMAGWAAAPVVAGIGMEKLGLGAPLLAAAALKIAYDLVLWFSFRHLPPPEERAESKIANDARDH